MRRPSLHAERLAALAPRWQVEILPQTSSTNAVCAERARDGAPEGLVITTEHQYAGRGRLDRVWEMPPRAALASSILLRPDLAPERWTWLPLMTGVAVARTIAGRLKWPNDVLLGPELKKVCGILVERVETPSGPAAILGIGINTSLTREELPIPHATSLQIERERVLGAEAEAVNRTAVLETLLGEIAEAYALLVNDPDELAADYVSLSATLGQQVRAELPDGGALAGTASGIDRYGRLLITRVEGQTEAVGAGDIVHLRPLT